MRRVQRRTFCASNTLFFNRIGGKETFAAQQHYIAGTRKADIGTADLHGRQLNVTTPSSDNLAQLFRGNDSRISRHQSVNKEARTGRQINRQVVIGPNSRTIRSKYSNEWRTNARCY
jgi:hypothetical protein